MCVCRSAQAGTALNKIVQRAFWPAALHCCALAQCEVSELLQHLLCSLQMNNLSGTLPCTSGQAAGQSTWRNNVLWDIAGFVGVRTLGLCLAHLPALLKTELDGKLSRSQAMQNCIISSE